MRGWRDRAGSGGTALRTALLFLMVLITAVAEAQTTTGTIRGTVKEESGGVLPGTSIEAVNDATGVRYAATSQSTGFYNISVPPGAYTVTATLSNFTTGT